MTRAMLITPAHPERAADAVPVAADAAREAGVTLVCTADEHEKLRESAAGIEQVPDGERPDVCLVLGGDGSILYALRRFADTEVPVFGINFGTIGFLAAAERAQLADGLRRAFTGEYEVLELPALRADLQIDLPVALNDVSFVRRPHGRVAELSYTIGSEEVGNVRCDGLVVATPAGSLWWSRPGTRSTSVMRRVESRSRSRSTGRGPGSWRRGPSSRSVSRSRPAGSLSCRGRTSTTAFGRSSGSWLDSAAVFVAAVHAGRVSSDGGRPMSTATFPSSSTSCSRSRSLSERSSRPSARRIRVLPRVSARLPSGVSCSR
jgi:hypothetical protein